MKTVDELCNFYLCWQVVEMLIEQAKEQYLAFPLFTSDDIVIITDAGILNCKFNFNT